MTKMWCRFRWDNDKMQLANYRLRLNTTDKVEMITNEPGNCRCMNRWMYTKLEFGNCTQQTIDLTGLENDWLETLTVIATEICYHVTSGVQLTRSSQSRKPVSLMKGSKNRQLLMLYAISRTQFGDDASAAENAEITSSLAYCCWRSSHDTN